MDVIILLVSLVVGLVAIVVSVLIVNYLHENADARFALKKEKYRLKHDLKLIEQQLQALKDK